MDQLPKDFSAIDSALSLHFSSSITTPKLFQICQKATALAGRRITNSTLELILGVDESLFTVTSSKGSYDYGITVAVPLAKYSSLLAQRRAQFEEKLAQTEKIEPVSLSEIAVLKSPVKCLQHRSPSTSPTKVGKYKHIEGLKNDRSKFSFKERKIALESAKADGLSLIERIKLKEERNSKIDPEQKKKEDYESLIRTRTPRVYDIIYELASASSANGASQSFTLDKVVSIIKDSSEYAISSGEIQDIVNDIESKLGTGRLQLIERGFNKVIRVFDLNREADLQRLNNNA